MDKPTYEQLVDRIIALQGHIKHLNNEIERRELIPVGFIGAEDVDELSSRPCIVRPATDGLAYPVAVYRLRSTEMAMEDYRRHIIGPAKLE